MFSESPQEKDALLLHSNRKYLKIQKCYNNVILKYLDNLNYLPLESHEIWLFPHYLKLPLYEHGRVYATKIKIAYPDCQIIHHGRIGFRCRPRNFSKLAR